METPQSQPDPEDENWTFVLNEPCPECGFIAADVDVHALHDLVLDATAPWTEVLAAPDATVRPAPQVWSPLEYACHVRDVHTIFDERVRSMRDQDEPTFANWDQDETAVEQRYDLQDPAAVARWRPGCQQQPGPQYNSEPGGQTVGSQHSSFMMLLPHRRMSMKRVSD